MILERLIVRLDGNVDGFEAALSGAAPWLLLYAALSAAAGTDPPLTLGEVHEQLTQCDADDCGHGREPDGGIPPGQCHNCAGTGGERCPLMYHNPAAPAEKTA